MNCQHPAQRNQFLVAKENKLIKVVEAFGKMLEDTAWCLNGMRNRNACSLANEGTVSAFILPGSVKEKSLGKKWSRSFCLGWNIMDHTLSTSNCTATCLIRDKHSK